MPRGATCFRLKIRTEHDGLIPVLYAGVRLSFTRLVVADAGR